MNQRNICSFFLVSVILNIVSCGKIIEKKSTLHKIIDENDLQPVKESKETEYITKAMGMMNLGCTVTHIGQGLALTAGHCFYPFKFSGIVTEEPCGSDDYDINWGLTVNNNAYMTSDCEQIVLLEHNSKKDYALFEVNPSPNVSIPIQFNGTYQLNQPISIFSFPKKRPLEWSGWCTIEDVVPFSNNNQFSYSCDTEGGSSGASVLNDQFEIVGIHNYYSQDINRNGATFIHQTNIADYIQ